VNPTRDSFEWRVTCNLFLAIDTYLLKVTAVSVILNEPPCKDDNVRFTTVSLKALSGQVKIRYSCFSLFKPFIFICGK